MPPSDGEDEARAPDASPLTTAQLGASAETSVKSAISRGRKRRAHTTTVATDTIDLRRERPAHPNTLINPARQLPNVPYHKRRRTSLIPGLDSGDDDDDSNDEWEEHVDVDDTVVAAIAASASQRAASVAASSSVPVAENAPESTTPTPSPAPAPAPVDPKRLARLHAAAHRKRLAVRHSVYLTLALSQLQQRDAAADDMLLRGVALSAAPVDALPSLELDSSLSGVNFDERLCRLALWARSTISTRAFVQRTTHAPTTGVRLCCAAARAVATLGDGHGDVADVVTALVAALRCTGARARVVAALQPVSVRSTRGAKVMKRKHAVTGRMQLVQDGGGKVDDGERLLYAWVEVWNNDAKRWRPLDIVEGRVVVAGAPRDVIAAGIQHIPEMGKDVDETKKTSAKRRSGRRAKREVLREVDDGFFAHVVAAERGMLTDVTRRYATSWAAVAEARAKSNLFGKALERLGRMELSEQERMTAEEEREELEAVAFADGIPSTVAAIQKHPHYVLERHLKKYEALYPNGPDASVGELRGEPVFPRRNVHVLHTRDRWIRAMREVDDGAEPVKEVKSKGSVEGKMVQLFGEWQTHELEITPVMDGVVPRSVHGNVDLWTAAHLPRGGAHVNMRMGRVAARRLGVDGVPAMTGFELRRGRSVPRLEGVVVPVEHEVAVRELAGRLELEAAERARQRAREEALVKWGRVLRAVAAREKVRQKYGGLDDGLTFEARQKLEGEQRARKEKDGRSTTDGGEEERKAKEEKEETIRRMKARVDGHVHEFGAEQAVDEKAGKWEKKCGTCGLRVQFERL